MGRIRTIGRLRAGGGGGAAVPVTPGALAWYYADQYQSSPRKYVPNAMSAVAVSPSLMTGPRRVFSSSLYTTNGVTVTDANANDRDGVANQASTCVGTGNWSIGINQAPQSVFPAGTYGFAFDYRRSGGTDQQIRGSWDFSGGTDLTATATWQRSPVISAVLSAAQHQPAIKSIDGVTAASFELCNFHVFAGTTDPYPLGEPLVGHLYLGKHLADTQPTYASGLVDLSGQGYGLVQFPAPVTMGQFTMVQSASRVSTLANYQALLSRVQSFATFTPYLEIDGYPRMGQNGTDRGVQGAGLWAKTGKGLHVMMIVYNGTDIRFYIDNILVCPPIVGALSSVTISDLWHGIVSGPSQYAGYKWNAFGLYQFALSAAERAATCAALVARAAATSNTITAPTRLYWAEGHSIPATAASGAGGSYAYQYGQSAAVNTWGAVLAVGGSTLATLTARITADVAYLVVGKKNLFTVDIGANDLYNYSGGGAQFATDVATYLVALRAAATSAGVTGTNFRIAVLTVLPRSDASLTAPQIVSHNTQRAIYNSAVTSTFTGLYCDGVIDQAANATIGPDAASNNTTLYPDNLHPAVATHTTYILPLAKTVLDAL